MADELPGWERIRDERLRQIRSEGWTPEHDLGHYEGALAAAAICYIGRANPATSRTVPSDWPWDDDWWKPSDDHVRNLVKAGALIAAEIDRLTRPLPSDASVPDSDDTEGAS